MYTKKVLLMFLMLVFTLLTVSAPMAGATELPSPSSDGQALFDEEEISNEDQYSASDFADESLDETYDETPVETPNESSEETIPSDDFSEDTFLPDDPETADSMISVPSDDEFKTEFDSGNDIMNNVFPEETKIVPGNIGEDFSSGPEEVLPAIDETEKIQVTVPGSGRAIVNPYGMKITLDDVESFDQIVSTTQTIKNHSAVPVTVLASTVGRISEESDAVFVSDPPLEDSTRKEIFVYTEFRKSGDDWLGSFLDTDSQILVSDQPSEQKPVVQLDADGAEGEFRLFGETTFVAGEPWSEADTFEVVITFTFLPLQDETAISFEVENEVPEIQERDMDTLPDAEKANTDDSQLPTDSDFASVPDDVLTSDTNQGDIYASDTEIDFIAPPESDSENSYAPPESDQTSGTPTENVFFEESE